jgi:DNA-binding NarL/FixJ family response regulator
MGSCGPILVVDDDPAVRELISTLLRRVGLEPYEAATTEEALALARRDPPALAVVDVDLGGGASGYELCQELRDQFGSVPVVFISGARTEPFDRVGGLLIGADDYVVKPFDPDELIVRLRNLAMRATRGAKAREEPDPRDPLSTLTPRERQVLRLLAGGLSQPEIARQLVVSPKTIASHIQNLLAKFGLHSRAQAVAFAYREGLVEDVAAGVVPSTRAT